MSWSCFNKHTAGFGSFAAFLFWFFGGESLPTESSAAVWSAGSRVSDRPGTARARRRRVWRCSAWWRCGRRRSTSSTSSAARRTCEVSVVSKTGGSLALSFFSSSCPTFCCFLPSFCLGLVPLAEKPGKFGQRCHVRGSDPHFEAGGDHCGSCF